MRTAIVAAMMLVGCGNPSPEVWMGDGGVDAQLADDGAVDAAPQDATQAPMDGGVGDAATLPQDGGTSDGGPSDDGSSGDAAVGEDAGSGLDAGSDAGTGEDGGQLEDGGTVQDGGTGEDGGTAECEWAYQCPDGDDPCDQAVCYEGECITASVRNIISGLYTSTVYMRNWNPYDLPLRGIDVCMSFRLTNNEVGTGCFDPDSDAVPAETGFLTGAHYSFGAVYQASIVPEDNPSVVCDHAFRYPPGDDEMRADAEAAGEWSGESIDEWIGDTSHRYFCADTGSNSTAQDWRGCSLCYSHQVWEGTSDETSVYVECE